MLYKSKIQRSLYTLTQSRFKVTFIEDAFGIPPALQVRRVVVTGLGLATPLGVGVKETWHALLSGRCGIKRLQPEDLPKVCLFFTSQTMMRELRSPSPQLRRIGMSEIFVKHHCHVLQGHDVALEKLPSKVAAMVPREQLQHAVAAAGLPAKGARFVNLAELAALEALQVTHYWSACVQALSADCECSAQTSQQCFPVLMAT